MSCQWKVLQHPPPAAGCADLYQALRELRTAAAMLVLGAHAERDRGLGVTMLHEISRAERAAAKIAAARHAVPPATGGLM